ncbi:hypothetical protein ACH5RR_025814 [Cinchona calisaya]|uniref:RNase H type-1 domain-containing protein n=1 Tax=Cinchona calisaya TaxID=153742 RepID=A0ABD2Z3Y2_9GENT
MDHNSGHPGWDAKVVDDVRDNLVSGNLSGKGDGDIKVQDEFNHIWWHGCVYLSCDPIVRNSQFYMLSAQLSTWGDDCMPVEDFNDLLHSDEKRDGKGVLKLNIDAAVLQKCSKTRFGVIARDSAGCIKGAWSSIYVDCSNLKLVEAFAIRFALFQALSQSWIHVVIQSDVESVINLIQQSRIDDVVISMKEGERLVDSGC